MNLTFYKTITPNTTTGLHYYFKDVEKYIAFLSTYEVTSLSIQNQNFVLNNEITSIELLDYANPYEITYIKYTYTNADGTSFHQFYNVISCSVISQKVILSVELDLWGTYIANVNFSNLQVARSNKDLGAGVFDPILETYLEATYTPLYTTPLGELTIAFSAIYETRSDVGIDKFYTKNLAMFTLPFSQVEQIKTSVGSTEPTIDFALKLVNGFIQYRQVLDNEHVIWSSFTILRAFFAERSTIAEQTTTLPLRYFVKDKKDVVYVKFARAGTIIKPFNIDISYQSECFVGTKFSNLKLPRTTVKNKRGAFYFITKQDGLEVKIGVGEKQLDITQSFELNLTANEGLFTATQKNSQILQSLGGLLAVGSGIATGGATAIIGGAIAGAATLNNVANYQSNASYTKGGDAFSTFRNADGSIATPYYLIKYLSPDDELEEVARTGVSYNNTISNLNDFLAANYIAGLDSFSPIPYIQAQIKVAEGAPQEAINLINQHLIGGVYVKEIA